MEEELNQFERNDVWELVEKPSNYPIIGTEWIFRNKLDENGIVIRNKARLVAKVEPLGKTYVIKHAKCTH